jgi:hypothetical protein
MIPPSLTAAAVRRLAGNRNVTLLGAQQGYSPNSRVVLK